METVLVKPGLSLALHHDGEHLWEEADGFWWCFVRGWTEKMKYFHRQAAPEFHRLKCGAIWREGPNAMKERKNSLWQKQTSRKCLKITCD